MDLVKIPEWIKKVFPQLVWQIPTDEKTIYLTFDDGPTPGVTPRVLDLLFSYHAKATFFCSGKNVEQYPSLSELIEKAGHTIGNHGYDHISGFKTSTKKYYENVRKGSILTQSYLFRPPYGQITPWQIRTLKKEYQIIMWSAMSLDYAAKCTPSQCITNVKNNAVPGAIIVFHDSGQASRTLAEILPSLLEWLNKNNFIMKSIPPFPFHGIEF